MIYTMIGSRKTPPEIMNLMKKFAYKAASKGYKGRSGGADGADTCLEDGVNTYLQDTMGNSKEDLLEVFLPWKDFNNRDSNEEGYYTLPFMPSCEEAYILAEDLHPAWNKCSAGAKALHSRNTMQVLGPYLDKPSRFILCYGEPEKKGSVIPKGGTRTACLLGQRNGVEIFNLYLKEHRERVEEWIK